MNNPEDTVPPSHARKPDPDEPWRYRCGDGSCRGQVRGRKDSDPSLFYCVGCGKSHTRSDVWDAKRDSYGVPSEAHDRTFA